MPPARARGPRPVLAQAKAQAQSYDVAVRAQPTASGGRVGALKDSEGTDLQTLYKTLSGGVKYNVYPLTESVGDTLARKGDPHVFDHPASVHEAHGTIVKDSDAIYKSALRGQGETNYAGQTKARHSPMYHHKAFAWSSWVKLNKPLQGSVYPIVVGKGEAKLFHWDGNTHVGIHGGGTNTITTDNQRPGVPYLVDALPVGQWFHVFNYYDLENEHRRIYVNGMLAGTNDGVKGASWWHYFKTQEWQILRVTSNDDDVSVDLPTFLAGLPTNGDNVDKLVAALYTQQAKHADTQHLVNPAFYKLFRALAGHGAYQTFPLTDAGHHELHKDGVNLLGSQKISITARHGTFARDSDAIYKVALRAKGEAYYYGYNPQQWKSPMHTYTSYAWSSWVKLNKPLQGSVYPILFGHRSRLFRWDGNTHVGIHGGGTNAITTDNMRPAVSYPVDKLPTGQWFHVFNYYDLENEHRRVYVNGLLVGTNDGVKGASWWNGHKTREMRVLYTTSGDDDVSIDLPTYYAKLPTDVQQVDKVVAGLWEQQASAADSKHIMVPGKQQLPGSSLGVISSSLFYFPYLLDDDASGYTMPSFPDERFKLTYSGGSNSNSNMVPPEPTTVAVFRQPPRATKQTAGGSKQCTAMTLATPASSAFFTQENRVCSLWVMFQQSVKGTGVELLRIFNTHADSDHDMCVTLDAVHKQITLDQKSPPIPFDVAKLPTNAFLHVALTYNAKTKTLMLFINGDCAGSTPVSSPPSWWTASGNKQPLGVNVLHVPIVGCNGISKGYNDITVDLPMMFATTSAFGAAQVRALYAQQVGSATRTYQTSHFPLSAYAPRTAALVPFAHASYANDSSVTVLPPAIQPAQISKASLQASDKGAGLVTASNPNGYAATGTLKLSVGQSMKTWVVRTYSVLSVWFSRQTASALNAAAPFTIGGPVGVHFADNLGGLAPTATATANHTLPVDVVSSVPVNTWNQLLIRRQHTSQNDVLEYYMNGQYLGKVTAATPQPQNSTAMYKLVAQTAGPGILLQDLRWESAPYEDLSRNGSTAWMTKTMANVAFRAMRAAHSHNKSLLNTQPVLTTPIFPDPAVSPDNDTDEYATKIRLALAFPDNLKQTIANRSPGDVSYVRTDKPVFGPLAGQYTYAAGGSAKICAADGIYGGALYNGANATGTLTLHDPQTNTEMQAWPTSHAWAVCMWVKIASYPVKATTVKLLEMVSPNGNDDNSNGLCISMDISTNCVQVLKKADNRAFMYVRKSCPAGKWFLLSVARTGQASFNVRLNGCKLQDVVTSKTTKLPAWWGQRTPRFVLGGGDVPLYMDRVAWLTEDMPCKAWQTRVIANTSPSGWTLWHPDYGVPRKLLPASIDRSWAASLFTNKPSAPQELTGQSGIQHLTVEKLTPADLEGVDEETDADAAQRQNGIQADSNAIYKQALQMAKGHMLHATSNVIHNWIQNKAFVLSMWFKPHDVMTNDMQFFGVTHPNAQDAAPQCKLDTANQQLHVMHNNHAVPLDVMFSLPAAQWVHFVLHRVGQTTFRVYVNGHRLGHLDTKDLPSWWGSDNQAALMIGRQQTNNAVSMDLPFWFLGNEAASVREDRYGNNVGDDGSGTWGDSLVRALHKAQLKAAPSTTKNVSQTRPLNKVVLGTDSEATAARNTIGMLTVFPEYAEDSETDTKIGGNYGPHAGTFAYMGIGSKAQPVRGKGLYQSAMKLPPGNTLSMKSGNTQYTTKAPTHKGMRITQDMTSDADIRGISLWFSVDQWTNTTLNVFEIVPHGTSETLASDDELLDGSGDNNLILQLDKANNRVLLFPNEGSPPEAARMNIEDVFPGRDAPKGDTCQWAHVHIVRTSTKTFELFINGYAIHTFTAPSLPSWWGTKTPEFHFGRGNITVYADYIMFHHAQVTSAHRNAIIAKSRPPHCTLRKAQTLIPTELLPDFLDSTWASYLLASSAAPGAQHAHGRQPMPTLQVNDKTKMTVDEATPVYKTALTFEPKGFLRGTTTSLASLLGNADFVVQLWVKPTTAWSHGGTPVCLLRVAPSSGSTSAFEIALDTAHTQVVFAKDDNGTAYGVPLAIEHSMPVHKWSSIAVQRHQQTFTVYVNGDKLSGKTFSTAADMPAVFRQDQDSGTSMDISFGCVDAPSNATVTVDMLQFFAPPPSTNPPWSASRMNALWNTVMQASGTSKTAFVRSAPLTKPVFPGAGQLWNCDLKHLFVFLGSSKSDVEDMVANPNQYPLTLADSNVSFVANKGVYKGALKLSGASKGVRVTGTTQGWTARPTLAFSAWIKIATWPEDDLILFQVRNNRYKSAKQCRMQLALNAAKDTISIVRGNPSDAAVAKNEHLKTKLPTGQWNHVALVRTSVTKLVVYFNGSAVHTFSFSSTSNVPLMWRNKSYPEQIIFLQTPNDSSTSGASVLMDRPTVWNAALSKDNVETLVNATAPKGFDPPSYALEDLQSATVLGASPCAPSGDVDLDALVDTDDDDDDADNTGGPRRPHHRDPHPRPLYPPTPDPSRRGDKDKDNDSDFNMGRIAKNLLAVLLVGLVVLLLISALGGGGGGGGPQARRATSFASADTTPPAARGGASSPFFV